MIPWGYIARRLFARRRRRRGVDSDGALRWRARRWRPAALASAAVVVCTLAMVGIVGNFDAGGVPHDGASGAVPAGAPASAGRGRAPAAPASRLDGAGTTPDDVVAPGEALTARLPAPSLGEAGEANEEHRSPQGLPPQPIGGALTAVAGAPFLSLFTDAAPAGQVVAAGGAVAGGVAATRGGGGGPSGGAAFLPGGGGGPSSGAGADSPGGGAPSDGAPIVPGGVLPDAGGVPSDTDATPLPGGEGATLPLGETPPPGVDGLDRAAREDLAGEGVPPHVSVVPAPAALPLLGSALAVLAMLAWRRRQPR